MSTTTVLCAFCESLPQRVPGRMARIIRCPLCKTDLEVTSAGAKFRVCEGSTPAASPRRPWTPLACGAGVGLAVVLVLVVAIWLARTREHFPGLTQATTAVAFTDSPAQGIEARAVAEVAGAVEPIAKPASVYVSFGETKPSPAARKPRAVVPTDTPVAAAAPEALPFKVVLARETGPEPDWTKELLKVPEAALHPAAKRPLSKEEARKLITDTTALIRDRDTKTKDGFIRGLQDERPDLAGLPFLLGSKCRLDTTAARVFREAVLGLRGMGSRRGQRTSSLSARPSDADRPVDVAGFWQAWTSPYYRTTVSRSKASVDTPDVLTTHGVAALTQILGPANQPTRLSLADLLRFIDHPKADEALVKSVLFDVDAEVRERALSALASRPSHSRAQANLKMVAKGLGHPWPVVAERAARALAALGGQDAAKLLTEFLNEPDPAAPFPVEQDGVKHLAVREVVRINHHRNCQLCHSPATPPAGVGDDLEPGLVGIVPSLAEPLPSLQYYPSAIRDHDSAVRADVTYLRQDFSVMLPVDSAEPWPKMQRFDFLVRTRVLKDDEAAALTGRPVLSPQHRAALAALRDITGADAGWRASGRAALEKPSRVTAALPETAPRAILILSAAE